MDEARRRAMRTQHTVHRGYCTCGKIVHGNGGKAGHAYMHERKQDGHMFVTSDRYRQLFPEKFEHEATPPRPNHSYEVIDGKVVRKASDA